MSTPTAEVVVTEYFKPFGGNEPSAYHVRAVNAHVVASLDSFGMHICCDIYPDGFCRVYIYDPISEIAVATSPKRSHSVATDLLDDLLYNFDFRVVI